MTRIPCLLLMPLMLGGATQMPNMVEVGRTATTLSDWQTIMYFLIVMFFVQFLERLISAREHRITLRQMSGAMDRLAEAQQSRSMDINVTLALLQQGQQDLSRKLDR